MPGKRAYRPSLAVLPSPDQDLEQRIEQARQRIDSATEPEKSNLTSSDSRVPSNDHEKQKGPA